MSVVEGMYAIACWILVKKKIGYHVPKAWNDSELNKTTVDQSRRDSRITFLLTWASSLVECIT